MSSDYNRKIQIKSKKNTKSINDNQLILFKRYLVWEIGNVLMRTVSICQMYANYGS
jgi:hypothetical protein